MKRLFALLACAVLLAAPSFAQNKRDEGKKQVTNAEMIKARTDRMAERYGLDEAQKSKLLELNTEFDKKFPAGPGRGPQGGPQAGRGERGDRQEMTQEQREKMREEMKTRRAEFAKVQAEYEAGIKAIFTEQQFKQYTEDQEKMRQEREKRGQMRGRQGGPGHQN